MTTNPSRKLPKVFALTILQVILIHFSKSQLELVLVVCSPRSVLRRLAEVRIFVLIIPQIIRIHFGEWEVVVVRRRRGLKIGSYDSDAIHTAINRKFQFMGTLLSLFINGVAVYWSVKPKR